MITFNIEFNIPSDNFYLQWDYIYWWQFRLNMSLSLQNYLKGLELSNND